MRATKKIVLVFTVLLIVGKTPITAMAHGSDHEHGHGTNGTVHGLCNVAGCTAADVHQHDGEYYFEHSLEDGHDYHKVCDKDDCVLTGIHQHDSAYYYGHSAEDGRDYHVVCSLEECTLTDVHQHDGVYYCGHSLEDSHDYHAVCSIKECTEISEHGHGSGTTDNAGSRHGKPIHNHKNHSQLANFA